jgi:hypothetical protein
MPSFVSFLARMVSKATVFSAWVCVFDAELGQLFVDLAGRRGRRVVDGHGDLLESG